MTDLGRHGSLEESELHVQGEQGMEQLNNGQTTNTAELWRETLKRVVNCVVVLKVTQTRAFDTEGAGSSYATGFVVDKQRGLILTNRHVVTPGPIVAEAVFQNREEVPVYPLYYDPIHDFGVMRFDTSKLRFMELDEIPLAPEAAVVGIDIRVVGNDSGEKISILSGTLARLDRDAPHYGKKSFNDFNTFYLQAASGTKGGSSGSPVIDVFGRAIGLNAGGKNKAASAYYLPLHRVVRALDELQKCLQPDGTWKPPQISRGDLQATFLFKGFDEVKRLGLRSDTEAMAREVQQMGSTGDQVLAGRSTGMLVVDSIVPGGPCDGVLEPGDVLCRLEGEHISGFLEMEALLDEKVGRAVEVEVERGGKTITSRIKVQNLHDVTPNQFIEIGGASVNSLSYQQARNQRAATGQVYVADPGYLLAKAGVPKHAIITKLAGKPTPSLNDFLTALCCLAHGQRVPIQFFTFQERFRTKSSILHVDWNWYGPLVLWTRDDANGVWNSRVYWTPEMAALPAVRQAEERIGVSSPRISSPRYESSAAGSVFALPRKHSIADIPDSSGGEVDLEKRLCGVTCQPDDTRLQQQEEQEHQGLPSPRQREAWRVDLERNLRCGLVNVDVEIPLVALPDGVHSRTFAGCGMIVHHSDNIGLIVIDRNTVVVGPGDIVISFGAFPAEVSGKTRFLHPLHNFSIISYDPSELSEEARRAIKAVNLQPDPPLERGEEVELVCLSKSLRIIHRTSAVTNPAMSGIISRADVPRFRAVHEEVIKLDQDFGVAYSGVLATRGGAVRALWASYSEQVDKEDREWCAGCPASYFAPWVDELINRLDPIRDSSTTTFACSPPPKVLALDVELEPVLLSKAAQFGLPTEWVARLAKLDPEKRQVLRVRTCVAGSDAQKLLKDGDMVLAIAGRCVSAFSDLERILQKFEAERRIESKVAAVSTGGGHTTLQLDSATTTANGNGKRNVSGANGNDNISPSTKKIKLDESMATDSKRDRPTVPILVYREGQVLEVNVQLGEEDGLGTNRIIHWAGAQLQEPHRNIRELGFLPENSHGVYISRWHHGSPAHRYGLYALHWITEVNGTPVSDIDGFLEIVNKVPDGGDVRLKMVHFSSAKTKVLTLKTDLRYWPTWELVLDPVNADWTRKPSIDELAGVVKNE